MDSSQLKDTVDYIARALATEDQYAQAIDQYFADDVIFVSPAHVAKGKGAIENVVGLHQAFRSKADVGQIEWDNENRTATFTVKSRYRLPLSNLPRPASVLAKYDVPIHWDVSVLLEPDHSIPTPSPSSQGDVDEVKHHVTKVSVPSQAHRYRPLELVYNIIMFGLRLITPVVIGIASIVINFFQRHPLSQGIIKTVFSAVYEITAWVLNFIVEHIPVVGRKLKSARAKLEAAAHDVKAAPNVDSAPSSPAPVEKRKPRKSARHDFGLGFDQFGRSSAVDDRPAPTASPNFKGNRSQSKSTADPPAVALDSAVGSNSGTEKPKANADADESVSGPPVHYEPLAPVEDSPPAPAAPELNAESSVNDDPSPDNVSTQASVAATSTDSDSGGEGATSPSPAPHLNLHASDGHAAKHRKGNKKKRNNNKKSQEHANYHYSHNVHTIKKAEGQ